MMKDWECITDLLLENSDLSEERMDNRHKTSFIELMVCCIKQPATGEAPVGNRPNRKIYLSFSLYNLEIRLNHHF